MSDSTSTTVRLTRLPGETTLPIAVDVLVFTILFWTLESLGVWDGWVGLALIVGVALAHYVQMAWLVAVRFDDDGLTIIRPWRRRRVQWSEIGGLVHTETYPTGGDVRQRAYYKLHVVLKGHEPQDPVFATDAETKRLAKEPVVMTMQSLEPNWPTPNRADHVQEQVYSELERRGFAKPRRLVYRSSEYTPEQDLLDAAIRMIGSTAVTVTRPAIVTGDDDVKRIDKALGDLAHTHGASEENITRKLYYTVYAFPKPHGQRPAATFLAAARAVVPADWQVSPGARPAPHTPDDDENTPAEPKTWGQLPGASA